MLFKKKRERFGYTFWGPKCLFGRLGAGSNVSQLGAMGGCYLGVGVCLVTRWGYLVWHLRECLGTLNVLYCLGQSRQREISPAQDNQ